MPLDPLTAAFWFAGKLCDLLGTAQGQIMMADIRAANQDFVKKMSDIFDRAHTVVTKA